MIAIFMGASGLFNLPQRNYFKPKAIGRQALPTSFEVHIENPTKIELGIGFFI
jgi:hypothetical protein